MNYSINILLPLLSVTTVSGAYWKSTSDWQKNTICSNKEWMNGMCTAGAYRDCDNGKDWKAKMASCKSGSDDSLITVYDTPRTWSDGSIEYVAGGHGERVQCPVDRGFAAVGLCSSGRYNDCMPNAGSHKNQWVSHFLVCAPGLDNVIVKSDFGEDAIHETYEKSAEAHGAKLTCNGGDVAYMMCASGMYNDCKNKHGDWVAQILGCVKIEKEVDPAEVKLEIDEIRGTWVSKGEHTEPFFRMVKTSVVNQETLEENNSYSKTYDFSQELTVGYSRGLSDGLTFDATVGFGQGLESAMSQTITTSITNVEEEEKEYSCEAIFGKGAKIGEKVVLYQWHQASGLSNGLPGPTVGSDSYMCVPLKKGHPVCHPTDCLNKWCTVCKAQALQAAFDGHQQFCHDYFGPKNDDDFTPDEKTTMCRDLQCGTYDHSHNSCVLEDDAVITCDKFTGNPEMCGMIGCDVLERSGADGDVVHECFGTPFSKNLLYSSAPENVSSMWLGAILGMLALLA